MLCNMTSCTCFAALVVISVSAHARAAELAQKVNGASLNDKVRIAWSISGVTANDSITFTVEAATLGWIGIGFSPNGGMPGADIVIGGVKDGVGYLWDRHVSDKNGFPANDKSQDYTLLEARENNTHTFLRFRRLLVTCDIDDLPIDNDTVRLIWAYHSIDAESADKIAIHQVRGGRSLYLLTAVLNEATPIPTDAKLYDVTHKNVSIAADLRTYYHCKLHQLPDWKKHQIIRFDPLIQPGHEGVVHHMMLYHCFKDLSKSVGLEGPCYGPGSPFENIITYCGNRWLTVLAVGGQANVFPEDMGIPFFEEGQYPFLILEIHYDNSKYQPIVDNSGIRLYFVEQLRPLDVGSLLIGAGVMADELFIPPKQKAITHYAFCMPECTKNFPPEGIKVIGAFLHQHTAGTALRVRHIRNGTELSPVVEDLHYDFNYQSRKMLRNPVTVLPGDALMVECTYSTPTRQNTTFGGIGTVDEMCFVQLDYVNRTKSLFVCKSSPTFASYAKAIGTVLADPNAKKPAGKNEVIEPVVVNNLKLSAVKGKDDAIMTMPQYLATYDWQPPGDRLNENGRTPRGELFQQQLENGDYWAYCAALKSPVLKKNSATASNRNAYARPVTFFQSDSIQRPQIVEPLKPSKLDSVCSAKKAESTAESKQNAKPSAFAQPQTGSAPNSGSKSSARLMTSWLSKLASLMTVILYLFKF